MGSGQNGRFVSGDPQQKPGPGRPTNAWKAEIAARLRPALDVYDESLAGKMGKGFKFAAAKDLVTLNDPDRNKQKHEVTGSVQWVIELPQLVASPPSGQKALSNGEVPPLGEELPK